MPHVQTSTAGEVAYHTNGDYPTIPLVLLHGFCEDHSVWTPWLAHLADVPVMRIDLPGFGGSSLPPSADMRHYAKAVLAVLDEHGIEQCILHGHSLGGYAALEFAEGWPERLAGLGLFHSHPYTDQPANRKKRLQGIELLRRGKRDQYVAQLFPGEFTPAFAKDHPDIIQKLIETGREQPAEAIITALEIMLGRRDHADTLRNLSVPVQIIQGEADTIVPLQSATSAAKLPKIVDLEILPDVAHMGMFEAADRTAGMVQSFWADCVARLSAESSKS
ncbi:MAG: alpha/beta hydrolase [Saprospiraceae bacterium]